MHARADRRRGLTEQVGDLHLAHAVQQPQRQHAAIVWLEPIDRRNQVVPRLAPGHQRGRITNGSRGGHAARTGLDDPPATLAAREVGENPAHPWEQRLVRPPALAVDNRLDERRLHQVFGVVRCAGEMRGDQQQLRRQGVEHAAQRGRVTSTLEQREIDFHGRRRRSHRPHLGASHADRFTNAAKPPTAAATTLHLRRSHPGG